MTISSNVRKAGPYTGNDVTVAFPFTFKVFQASDLICTRMVISSGVETVLTINSDYTVSLNADQNANPGGTVTTSVALASTFTLTISSFVEYLQPTDLTNQGGFYPSVITDSLDRACIQIQQLKEVDDRSIKIPVSTSGISTELPIPEASKVIGWDATGVALQNYDASELASVVAYGTAVADTFTGTGSQTDFTLSYTPYNIYNLDVSINGVTQVPNVDYTWTSGTTLTFTTAPGNGLTVLARYFRGLPQGSIDWGSITSTPFVSSAVAINTTTSASGLGYTSIEMLKGGSFVVANGCTFTIDVPFKAGLFQCFSGSGTVAFGTSSVSEVCPEWWGIDGTADDTEILKALASITKGVVRLVAGKTYTLSGSATINLDVGQKSLIGEGTKLNCAAMTAATAVQVYSTLAYPESHYSNGTHSLKGIIWVGNKTSLRNGLVVGHATYGNNGQTRVEDCAFVNFDTNIGFVENAWRSVFYNVASTDALSHTLYFAPTVLNNSGEVFAFYHCQIYDGLTSKILVAMGGCQVNMYSCSILNQPIEITGTTSRFSMFGGNVENPANATPYVYVTNNGNNALFSMDGTNLTLNADATFTNSVFQSTNSESTFSFRNIIWPDGAHLQFETNVGYRAFVSGSARVILDGNSYWPHSAGYKCPVAASCNALYNGDFETGNTNGWTVAAYGTGGSTGVASATAKKIGTYGLLVTTVAGGGINVTQKVKCKPGQLVQVFAWVKVATAGSAPIGYIQARFYDVAGNQISVIGDEITSTSWVMFGSTQTGYAPAGADSFEITINGNTGGPNIIYVDNVIVNIH